MKNMDIIDTKKSSGVWLKHESKFRDIKDIFAFNKLELLTSALRALVKNAFNVNGL